jgi:HD superfamily phosphohydrolase
MIRQLMAMDDPSCMHSLQTSSSPVARELAERLYGRRLYKRALFATTDKVNTPAFQAGMSVVLCRDYAERIADAAGIRPHEVLVDIPAIPRELSLGVRVKNQHDVVSFEEFSPRIRTLNATRREQWRLGVYTLPEHREAVAEAGCAVLHIRKPTRQDTLF